MAQLDEQGVPVELGSGVTVITPGLAGTISLHEAGSDGMRGAEASTEALEAAFGATEVESQLTLEITDSVEIPVDDAGTRSTAYGESAMVVTVPDAGDSFGQAMIYADESGVLTWHFPVDEDNEVDVTRGAETRTYVIPRHVGAASDEGDTRGLLGAIGKKILKVVVWPIVDPLIGKIGDYFVSKWEKKNRPYGIRTFTAANHDDKQGTSIGPGDTEAWKRLAAGPVLLMVHGTFSRASTAFARLPRRIS